MAEEPVEPVPPNELYRAWHWAFGLFLQDCLHGKPFSVELEKDLSERKQLVDVIVVRS